MKLIHFRKRASIDATGSSDHSLGRFNKDRIIWKWRKGFLRTRGPEENFLRVSDDGYF